MPVHTVIKPTQKDIGGLMVRRSLPHAQLRAVGPFVFWDHFGPADYAPGHGVDVRPHPHIGLATISYLFEGELTHRDTTGVTQSIRPGDVNWMTAGDDIVHSERTAPEVRAAGHRLHGIQSWIALPREHEHDAPSFAHHPASALPRISADGVETTVIAGEFLGEVSPVATLSPLFYAAARLDPKAQLTFAANHAERAVYIAEGSLAIGEDQYVAGDLVALAAGQSPPLVAQSATRALLFGGAALDGPRRLAWNFVASDPADLDKAKRDWIEAAETNFAGNRFNLPEGETEFIPPPEDWAGARAPGRRAPTT